MKNTSPHLLILLFFLCSSLCTAQKKDFSLLFSPQEIQLLRAHSQKKKNIQMSSVPPLKTLSLEAILFIDASHWTLWLNGKKVNGHEDVQTHFPDLTIEKVTAESVHFSWKRNAITLKPYQTSSFENISDEEDEEPLDSSARFEVGSESEIGKTENGNQE